MGQSLTPRQIRSLQNIDRLVKTAITMFQQQGYDAVTIDDICAECGMSKGVFYYRFRSKEDLVAYAHKNFCDDHVSQQMKYDESQPLRTQLKDYLTAQFDFSKAFGKLLIARGLQGMFSAYHQKLTGDDVSWSEERDDKEESYSSYMVRRLSARGAREKAFRGGMSEMEAAALLRSFVFGNRMMWLFHEPKPASAASPPERAPIDLFGYAAAAVSCRVRRGVCRTGAREKSIGAGRFF